MPTRAAPRFTVRAVPAPRQCLFTSPPEAPPEAPPSEETPPAPPEPTADELRRRRVAEATSRSRDHALSAYALTPAPYVYYLDGTGTMKRLFHEQIPAERGVQPPKKRRVWRTVLVRGPNAALQLEDGEEEYVDRWVYE